MRDVTERARWRLLGPLPQLALTKRGRRGLLQRSQRSARRSGVGVTRQPTHWRTLGAKAPLRANRAVLRGQPLLVPPRAGASSARSSSLRQRVAQPRPCVVVARADRSERSLRHVREAARPYPVARSSPVARYCSRERSYRYRSGPIRSSDAQAVAPSPAARVADSAGSRRRRTTGHSTSVWVG